jgi:SAM-dependent methyltransferase
MEFKDHFSAQSQIYADYRPTYPDSLFSFLSETCKTSGTHSLSLAIDCATGNGQAAVALADFFASVHACDASLEQLDKAVACPRVHYTQGAAEVIQLGDNSADLITVAQALHWFDIPAFYIEARRVLKPSGILAVWCYENCSVSTEVDAIYYKLYKEILGSYWSPERQLVETGYSQIQFPFDELPSPTFSMEKEWTLEQYMGYLRTWSSTQKYVDTHQADPVSLIEAELEMAWATASSSNGTNKVVWPIAIRLGRNT